MTAALTRKFTPYPFPETTQKAKNLCDLGEKQPTPTEEIIYYRLALKEDPNYLIARTNICSALFDDGRYQECVKESTELIAFVETKKLDPVPHPYYDRAVSLEALGLIDREEGREAEARKKFNDAINDLTTFIQNPYIKNMERLVQGYCNRADIYEHLGEYEKAERDYKEAMRLDPEDPGVYHDYANLLKSLDRYEEAHTFYQKALELAPNDSLCHCSIGNLYNTSSILYDPKKALEHYKIAKSLIEEGRDSFVAKREGNMQFIKDSIAHIIDLQEAVDKFEDAASKVPKNTIVTLDGKEVHLEDALKSVKESQQKVSGLATQSIKTGRDSEIDKRFEEMHQIISSFQSQLERQSEILKLSGAKRQAELNKQISSLSTNEKFYYKTFYFSLSEIVKARMIITSGLIEAHREETLAQNGLAKATELASNVPIVGGVLGVIGTIAQVILEKRLENKFILEGDAITKYFQEAASRGINDRDILFQEIALTCVKQRKDSIAHPKESEDAKPSWFKSKLKEVKRNAQSLNDEILGQGPGLYDTDNPIISLAIKDLAIVLANITEEGIKILYAKNAYRLSFDIEALCDVTRGEKQLQSITKGSNHAQDHTDSSIAQPLLVEPMGEESDSGGDGGGWCCFC